jgi:hypothetical protein
MKAICPTCEQAFELANVTASEELGLTDGEDTVLFHLLPEHPPREGKATGSVVSEQTGELIRLVCWGSLRPVTITIH